MEFNHLLKKDLIKSICSVLNNYIILVFEEHGEKSSFESSLKKKNFIPKWDVSGYKGPSDERQG